MTQLLAPPTTPPDSLDATLYRQGHAARDTSRDRGVFGAQGGQLGNQVFKHG